MLWICWVKFSYEVSSEYVDGEHLLQSIETKHRLTAPAQLTTLTRLDQDMKQIMDSSLLEDEKVMLLDQLLQRYQGLTKQMKREVSVKPKEVLPKSDPVPPIETTSVVNKHVSTPKVKTPRETPRQLPPTPVTTKQSKLPVRVETPLSALPEESAHAIMMETPPDSKRKTVKRRNKPKGAKGWYIVPVGLARVTNVLPGNAEKCLSV